MTDLPTTKPFDTASHDAALRYRLNQRPLELVDRLREQGFELAQKNEASRESSAGPVGY